LRPPRKGVLMTPAELVERWRRDAETLAAYDERLASIARRHADDLDAALLAVADEGLDLATAAKESGYSVDRLRHMVSDGDIPNAGRKGSPRIRRGDLPLKRRASGSVFDASAIAGNILGGRA